MLTLLSPAALWALAALALPVALHLWRQPPRTVRLGSLRFLRAQAGARWRDLRWRERLLLGVRLALLTLLALVLARPVWRHPLPHTPQRWALLDPAALLQEPSLSRWRALEAAGYEGRRLAVGFPGVEPLSTSPGASPADVWSLLQEADANLPEGSSLAVFSPGRMAGLRGVRPLLRSRVEWVTTRDAASAPAVWLQAAHPAASPGGGPILQIGISDANQLGFTGTLAPKWAAKTIGQTVRLTGPDGKPGAGMPVKGPERVGVLILHDADRAEEARLLTAALRAATEGENGSGLDLHAVVVTPDLPSQPETRWTFWLSGVELPAVIAARSGALWQDAPGAGIPVDGSIVPEPGTPGAEFLQAPVRIWRRTAPPPTGGSVEWTDGQGTPLLTRAETPHGPRWRFASRFDLAWSDLARTSVLPALLRSFLHPGAAVDAAHDLRQAAADQAQPGSAAASDHRAAFSPPPSGGTTLHRPLGLLVACLLGVERMLSHLKSPDRARAARRESEAVAIP